MLIDFCDSTGYQLQDNKFDRMQTVKYQTTHTLITCLWTGADYNTIEDVLQGWSRMFEVDTTFVITITNEVTC